MLRYIFFILGMLLIPFTGCHNKEWEIKELHGAIIPVDNNTQSDKHIEKLIAPYKVQLDTIMNEVLCYSTTPVKHFMPESPLGNFVADLSFAIALENGFDADMCLLNHFGLRTELSKGAITRRAAYELMPFENELVVIRLEPEEMQRMFTYIENSNGHPIANLSAEFSNTKDRIEINGNNWDKNKAYHVLTTDYLAKGGDRMLFFKKGKLKRTGIKLRDAILDYMTKQDTIRTGTDGRLVFLNKKRPAPTL